MKNIFLIAALIFSTIMVAQNKPTFEKDGNMIKGTFFHDNGQVQQEGFYKKGKLHGEWISYNAQGERLALAQYDNGKKVGKWFMWNNGVLTEVDYVSNKIASVTEWSGKNTVVTTE